ncbi:zinc-ribbon domain-containing protein [Bacillus sp. Marseille-P3661]|uniref:zinc-ribbon domain-containing protein n=1 Tax=Bacillus sp. Marseille-P3661 TaxID=1936234 RepID=UPI000C841A96|nr:zinc-ribbon domain-containing protein [Bacillus sp. Marseille-P3661]
MALISCPECSREISDKVKSCPHCGYPLDGEQESTQKVELTSVNLKMEKRKKKKLLTLIISLLVVGLLLGVGYSVYSKQQSEKIAAEYAENVDLLLIEMVASGAQAESLLNLTAKVWVNTIYEEEDFKTDQYTKKYGYFEDDFNVSLARLFADENTKKTIESIETSQDNVADLMKKLQNPPEDYQKAYETLSELYSVYQGVTDLAINPKGTLTSFNSNRNERIDKFMELLNKIETQLPEKAK